MSGPAREEDDSARLAAPPSRPTWRWQPPPTLVRVIAGSDRTRFYPHSDLPDTRLDDARSQGSGDRRSDRVASARVRRASVCPTTSRRRGLTPAPEYRSLRRSRRRPDRRPGGAYLYGHGAWTGTDHVLLLRACGACAQSAPASGYRCIDVAPAVENSMTFCSRPTVMASSTARPSSASAVADVVADADEADLGGAHGAEVGDLGDPVFTGVC